MEKEAALGEIAWSIIAIIFLIIGRFLLFPAVCQHMPLQLPGGDFDYCLFFR